MQTISIVNRRGGVGKTATVHALGAGLAHRGYKVLFIDLDSQSNLSFDLGAPNTTEGAMELLTGEVTAADVIRSAGPNREVIPATPALALADNQLTQTGREYRLKKALAPVRMNYDYIIIDTPPALGALTVNALTASDSCIIPAQAEIHSLQGIDLLNDTIDAVKEYTNPKLKIAGILLTRYNERTVISRDMKANIEEMARKMNTVLFSTPIRECIAIKEAQATQTDIFTYSPASNAADDYSALVDVIEGDKAKARIYDNVQWSKDKVFSAVPGQEISGEVYNIMFNMMTPKALPTKTARQAMIDHHIAVNAGFLMGQPHSSDKDGTLYLAFGMRNTGTGTKYYYLGLSHGKKEL